MDEQQIWGYDWTQMDEGFTQRIFKNLVKMKDIPNIRHMTSKVVVKHLILLSIDPKF